MKSNNTKWDKYSRRLIALDRPRILYLVIPKCGCTFVKNVLWFVENGQFHPIPARIHDDDNLFRRASDLEMDHCKIGDEPLAFTVLRNPVDRFMSLYFDKVIGSGRKKYVPLAKTLSEKRGLVLEPATLNDHRYNLDILIDWLEANLASEVDLPKEAHWTPQSYRKEIMRVFDLKVLTVDNLSPQLNLLLSPEIFDIQSVVAAAETNASVKPVSKSTILTPEIRRKINGVYAEDRRLYRKAKAIWETEGVLTGDIPIPRFSNLTK